jgi:hypothetical protein
LRILAFRVSKSFPSNAGAVRKKGASSRIPIEKGDAMPFTGQAFDPDVIAAMSTAYEKARRAIAGQAPDQILKEALAKRIIEEARLGHTDPKVLYERTIEAVGLDLSRQNGTQLRK